MEWQHSRHGHSTYAFRAQANGPRLTLPPVGLWPYVGFYSIFPSERKKNTIINTSLGQVWPTNHLVLNILFPGVSFSD